MTFRTTEPLGEIDTTGFSVEATDGGVGKIDEATFGAGASHLVIDTGPWIFGKKVLLPAGVVDRIDPTSETVFANRSKEEPTAATSAPTTATASPSPGGPSWGTGRAGPRLQSRPRAVSSAGRAGDS